MNPIICKSLSMVLDGITAGVTSSPREQNCRDTRGILCEARYNLLKDIKVLSQTLLEHKDVAAKLKSHGPVDSPRQD